MRSSELAQRASVNTETLRYYERRGLLGSDWCVRAIDPESLAGERVGRQWYPSPGAWAVQR